MSGLSVYLLIGFSCAHQSKVCFCCLVMEVSQLKINSIQILPVKLLSFLVLESNPLGDTTLEQIAIETI